MQGDGRVGFAHVEAHAGSQAGLQGHPGTVRSHASGGRKGSRPARDRVRRPVGWSRTRHTVPSPVIFPEVVRARRRHHPAHAGHRSAHRRRFRRGLRRGQAVVVGHARRRPGRGAVLGPRPRRRHPGRGRGDHGLRPHRRPVRRGPAGGGRGRGGRGPVRRRGSEGGGAHPPRRAPPERGGDPARDRGQGGQGRPAAPGRRGRPRRGRVDPPGAGPLRRLAPADPRGQQRGPGGRRRPGPHAVRRVRGRLGRHRHADRLRVGGSHHRLRAVRPLRGRRDRPHGRPAGHHQARRPPGAVGHAAGRHRPGWRRCAVPRGVRPRPREGPRRQGRLGLQGPARPAGGVAAGHAGRRRHDGRGVGLLRHRRRGHPGPAQRAHRGRRPHRLHVGHAALPQGRPGPHAATAAARATSTCRWSA